LKCEMSLDDYDISLKSVCYNQDQIKGRANRAVFLINSVSSNIKYILKASLYLPEVTQFMA